MEENEIAVQEAEEITDAFLNGWDGADAAAGPADQPENGAEETEKAEPAAACGDHAAESEDPAAPEADTTPGEKTGEEPEREAKPEEPKTWTLRYMDEERTVTEAEMTALAQKGLDYDRIRERYDAGKPVMELFNRSAKQAGMTLDEYVQHIRMAAKQAEGLDGEAAKRAVDLEDREAVIAAKEAEEAERRQAAEKDAAGESAVEEQRRADIAEFQRAFPEAARDANGIPKEVWDGVRSGQRLTVAYALWQAGQAKAEAEAARREAATRERNARNEARSTGSMRSAGNENRARDPFLDGFDS